VSSDESHALGPEHHGKYVIDGAIYSFNDSSEVPVFEGTVNSEDLTKIVQLADSLVAEDYFPRKTGRDCGTKTIVMYPRSERGMVLWEHGNYSWEMTSAAAKELLELINRVLGES
jgi:hypothetical protein